MCLCCNFDAGTLDHEASNNDCCPIWVRCAKRGGERAIHRLERILRCQIYNDLRHVIHRTTRRFNCHFQIAKSQCRLIYRASCFDASIRTDWNLCCEQRVAALDRPFDQRRLIPLIPVSLHLVLCCALEAAIFRCGIDEGGRVWPGKTARRALSGGIRRVDRRSRDSWPARGRGRSPGDGRRRCACGVAGSIERRIHQGSAEHGPCADRERRPWPRS